ncbi:hypothetical protein JRF66_04580 [Micrococcus luteus]|uniref:hypothetical protein n=1 Tax=Micrococcus luteus TaxID=1270 RepID=UPI0019D14C0B|nr:hypothetical protein [Micrococcus luteus]MBN6767733.1 hypothetical protein [Micrococcus luteus]
MRHDHPAVGVLALGLARRLGLPDTALLPDDAPAAGAEPRRLEVARQGVAEAEVPAVVVAGGRLGSHRPEDAQWTRCVAGLVADGLLARDDDGGLTFPA